VLLARPGRLAGAALVAAALCSGAAAAVADLLATRRGARHGDLGRPGTVTTVFRLGDEPDGVARAAIAAATEAGPVVVVVAGREPPAGLPDGVQVVRDDDLASGTQSAAWGADTDAVFLASGRTFVRPADLRAAAGLLAAGASWVVGAAGPLNRDAYGVDRRELVDAALRRRVVAAGLWLWEPDATLIGPELLREEPLPPGRPLGAWLRRRARSGRAGVTTSAVVALRAAPVAPAAYWPDAVARQRAAAADLGDAVVGPRTSLRARAAAVALAGRALFGWPALLWLLLPVLLADGLPVLVGVRGYLVTVGVLLAVRWLSLRRSLGIRPRLRSDVLAALYAAPASLSSVGALCTRRVGRGRFPVPTRPLVWASLVAAVIAAYGVMSFSPGTSGSRAAAAAGVVVLLAVWAYAIRALVEGAWVRNGFRVGLGLRGTIDGSPVRVVDGSPSGVGLCGAPPSRTVGDEVLVVVELPEHRKVALPGVIASRRGDGVVGVEVRPSGASLRDWAGLLVQSSGPEAGQGVPGHRHRRRPWPERLLLAGTVTTSVVVLGALALVLVGHLPLVVRTGSMAPSYRPGDVVLVELVPARDLRPGEVVSRLEDPAGGEDLTHRVESVRRDGDVVAVRTRGDANPSGETWTIGSNEVVGRVVLRIPWVGRPLTAARSAAMAAALVAGAVTAVGVLVARRRRPGGPPSPAAGVAGPVEGRARALR
jgi:signal peptidase I